MQSVFFGLHPAVTWRSGEGDRTEQIGILIENDTFSQLTIYREARAVILYVS